MVIILTVGVVFTTGVVVVVGSVIVAGGGTLDRKRVKLLKFRCGVSFSSCGTADQSSQQWRWRRLNIHGCSRWVNVRDSSWDGQGRWSDKGNGKDRGSWNDRGNRNDIGDWRHKLKGGGMEEEVD